MTFTPDTPTTSMKGRRPLSEGGYPVREHHRSASGDNESLGDDQNSFHPPSRVRLTPTPSLSVSSDITGNTSMSSLLIGGPGYHSSYSNGNKDDCATIMTDVTSRPASISRSYFEESGATLVEGDRKLSEVSGASDLMHATAPRRARPTSDGLGFPAVSAGSSPRKKFRSRFESVANLGVSSPSASMVDLFAAQVSMVDDSSASRPGLILREDGKPPINLVSGLIHSYL